MLEFIQWCFRSEDSTVATVLIGILIVWGLRHIAEGFRQ